MENLVDNAIAALYPGDDQPVWYTPDPTNDASGLEVEDWELEIRLKPGRVEQGRNIVSPAAVFAMVWNDPASQFEGMIPSTFTYGMVVGQWTMEIWRTNINAVKFLMRINLTVYAVQLKSTTTTSTTTTP